MQESPPLLMEILYSCRSYQTADERETLCIRQRSAGELYLHPPVDAGVSLSDSGCRRLSIRQRMSEWRVLLHPRMQESDTLSESGESPASSGCRSLSLSDSCLMQRLLHPLSDQETADAVDTADQTADAGDSLSDSGCRRMQETLYQTADAGDSCIRWLLSRQRMQETLYQTADAESLCISCLIDHRVSCS